MPAPIIALHTRTTNTHEQEATSTVDHMITPDPAVTRDVTDVRRGRVHRAQDSRLRRMLLVPGCAIQVAIVQIVSNCSASREPVRAPRHSSRIHSQPHHHRPTARRTKAC